MLRKTFVYIHFLGDLAWIITNKTNYFLAKVYISCIWNGWHAYLPLKTTKVDYQLVTWVLPFKTLCTKDFNIIVVYGLQEVCFICCWFYSGREMKYFSNNRTEVQELWFPWVEVFLVAHNDFLLYPSRWTFSLAHRRKIIMQQDMICHMSWKICILSKCTLTMVSLQCTASTE